MHTPRHEHWSLVMRNTNTWSHADTKPMGIHQHRPFFKNCTLTTWDMRTLAHENCWYMRTLTHVDTNNTGNAINDHINGGHALHGTLDTPLPLVTHTLPWVTLDFPPQLSFFVCFWFGVFIYFYFLSSLGLSWLTTHVHVRFIGLAMLSPQLNRTIFCRV